MVSYCRPRKAARPGSHGLKSMRKSLLLALLLTPLSVGVARGEGLYSGTVPVTGQGAEERGRALPDALIQVLQKLSGKRDLPPSPALDEGLAGAARLSSSFQYTQSQRATADGPAEAELLLVVHFVPEAVDRLLRELELPRWRVERQPIVVWPVVDDGSGRRLLPLEYQYAWDTLAEVADLRGLPVAWPGLSEELLPAIDLQLLWGGYTDQLYQAGSASDGVVIVAARREGPEWNVRWTFADASASSSWRTRDRELVTALVEGIHQLTDLVASVNSIGPAGLGDWQVDLRIEGLRGGADYARCLGYLEGLSLVDHVAIRLADPAGIEFRLDLNADPEFLQRTLIRGGVLEATGEADRWRLLP